LGEGRREKGGSLQFGSLPNRLTPQLQLVSAEHVDCTLFCICSPGGCRAESRVVRGGMCLIFRASLVFPYARVSGRQG